MAVSSTQTIEELLNNDDNYPTITSSQQVSMKGNDGIMINISIKLFMFFSLFFYVSFLFSLQFGVQRIIEQIYADVRYAQVDAQNTLLSQEQRDKAQKIANNSLQLKRTQHIKYMKKALLQDISSGYESLDASRPWLCYWNVNGLALLGEELTEAEKSR